MVAKPGADVNYGLNDVLIGWGGMAREANPAQSLQIATERSAFADLFDSQVHFAAFADAASQQAPTAGEPEPFAVTARQDGDNVSKAADLSRELGGVALSAPPVPAGIHGYAGGGSITPTATLPAPAIMAPAEPESPMISRLTSDLVRCQWSRTAFAACFRDGELNLYVRDDTLRGQGQIANVLKLALREMGVRPGEIKINGINAGA